ncbi:hypothetical protein B0T16DRAFT_459153 [Cercophora newfieldiana]|uniref:Uncharacterized protein n=1 Tax=Cercophora newfieldiana TaxID=92897 RepID=A0AA39XZ30_9PEZI|nr:hypothetical protein B0T16DRAFT_459153 [Cercophora newfieldiana]
MSYGNQPGAQQFPYGQHPYGQQPSFQAAHPQQPQPYPIQAQQPQHHAFPTPPQQPPRFAHLAHLPMYILSDPAAAARAAQEQQQSLAYRQELLGMMTPEPQLSAGDKATLMALEVTTGAQFFSPDKAFNNGIKAAYALEKLQDISNRESEIITLTRWAVPPEAGMQSLVVDVLEHVSLNAKWVGGNIVVKSSRPVELRVRGKWVADLRKEKTMKKGWTKSFNKKKVDEMALVGEKGKGDVPLEMVIRMERAVVGLEFTPIYNGFWKDWVVPAPS